MPRRPSLDTLVRLAAAHGQLTTGASLRQIEATTGLPAAVVANAGPERHGGKAPPWAEAEDEYLRLNLGWLTEEEMARHLGRTSLGIHLRWKRDLQLPAPTKLPECLTTQKVAETLGVDPKAAMRWVDEGRLRGRRLPLKRVTRSVRYADFKAWALRPANWIYFRPERVTDPNLKRLLRLKAQRWGDEWLTAGQAARLRGVCVGAINNAIHAGKLSGVKWGNWRLLRSEVLKPGLRFYVGKGGRDVPKVEWSEPADAFIVLTAAVGYSPEAAAELMGGQHSRLAWTGKRVAYRLATLKRSGRIPRLIREHGLNVHYRRGRLFADWKEYRRRFPGLARAMGHLKKGQPLAGQELPTVRRVLHAWAVWHGQTALARSLSASTFARVGEALRALQQQGVDPFAKPGWSRAVRNRNLIRAKEFACRTEGQAPALRRRRDVAHLQS